LATVLMGWELGGGLGHVQPLVRIARALAAQGHRPVFAVKDLLEVAPVLQRESFPVLQAPIWPGRLTATQGAFLAASYADILAIRGFADADQLYTMARAWQQFFEIVHPALIVCDHSPTLCLAAYGLLPVVLIGTGFTVPPAQGTEFPPLVPQATPRVPQDQLLTVIQGVQQRRGLPAPATLPELFARADSFVCTFPELDPYRSVRGDAAYGPLENMPSLTPPPAEPALFVYLSAEYEGVEPILTLLAKMKLPAEAYIRDAPRQLAPKLRELGVKVHDTPATMADVLPRVSAVLHHGGLLTTQEVLAAGRPQALLPRYLEQELTAQAVTSLGVGLHLSGTYTVQDVGRIVHQVIADPRFARQALATAENVHSRGPWQALKRIVSRCRELLEKT
jgi:hypothetical protein